MDWTTPEPLLVGITWVSQNALCFSVLSFDLQLQWPVNRSTVRNAPLSYIWCKAFTQCHTFCGLSRLQFFPDTAKSAREPRFDILRVVFLNSTVNSTVCHVYTIVCLNNVVSCILLDSLRHNNMYYIHATANLLVSAVLKADLYLTLWSPILAEHKPRWMSFYPSQANRLFCAFMS